MSETRVPGAAPSAPARFYERAELRPEGEGYLLTLDGRPARTPGRQPLALPTSALGEAVAAEWNAQGATIDPRSMPVTRLANSALDGVSRDLVAVRDDLARYSGSDLVAYRAGEPDRLIAEQSAAWDPVIAYARLDLGARLVLIQGIMFVEQPSEALARIRARIDRETSPFGLAALHVMTTLTGSVLLALMHADGRLGTEETWAAAHVDELFQESRWGADHEASVRRDARAAEFRVASRVYALSRV